LQDLSALKENSKQVLEPQDSKLEPILQSFLFQSSSEPLEIDIASAPAALESFETYLANKIEALQKLESSVAKIRLQFAAKAKCAVLSIVLLLFVGLFYDFSVLSQSQFRSSFHLWNRASTTSVLPASC
jgi:hypothetical protein